MRCYHAYMAVKKLSVALDEDTVERASSSARRLGLSLSAWLNRAAANALAIEGGLAAVAEWEAEHGPLTENELLGADAVLGRSVSRRRRKS